VKIEVKVPDIGTETVEITDILVCIGEKIKKDTGLMIVEGQKTSMEIPSPYEGVIISIKVKIGDQINTGTLIMILEHCKSELSQNQENQISLSSITIDNKNKHENINNENFIHATPVIRRLARELNIDLTNIIGTGPKKRILKEDIQNYQINSCEQRTTLESIKKNNTIQDIVESIDEIPLTKIEQRSGKNLYNNWNNVPHVTQFDESDITELEAFRVEYNASIKEKDSKIKLTLLVFIIKILSNALKKFPRFNSSLSDNHQYLIVKKNINIGIAVNTSDGLLVPVLKNTNIKTLLEIATELKEISEKARNHSLDLLDMQDSSFTISNLGGIGGTIFTPIINVPEVGILGVSKASIKPIWNEKTFIPRLILPLSLSYDHRVIDGVYAANFIVFINKLLSDIRLIMI